MKITGMTFAAALVCLATSVQAAPIVLSATGANAAAIQGTVDVFRASLGALNPNVAGSFGSGRREINWDGGRSTGTVCPITSRSRITCPATSST